MGITFSNIGLAEPSTLTKSVASVVIARGSTNEHQEVLVLGDPQSSLGLAQVLAAAPPSTTYALAVRLAGGPSSAVDVTIQTQGNSTVFQGTSPWVVSVNARVNIGSTAADNVVTVGAVTGNRINIGSTAADNAVAISGNSTVFQGGAPWTVAGNSTVVFLKASTSARSSVTQSSTSVTMQSSNANRLGWTCFNNPTQGANLYLKFGGGTASTADFDVRIVPFQYYEMPIPVTTELITGVWDSTGVGFARVREVLP